MNAQRRFNAERAPVAATVSTLLRGALLVSFLLLSGCSGTEETTSPEETLRPAVVGDRPIDRPIEGVPEAPAEFRQLWPTPDPEASRLFDSLAERPGDRQGRQQLAAHYRQTGFLAAAHLFEATLAALGGDTVVYEVPRSPIAWGLGEADAMARLDEERQRASEVCDLTLENRYQEAVDRASELLQDGPYSAVEVGVWSHAALWYIVADAGPIEDTVPEMAFRVFLTALEEGLEPECVATRASGHWLLSRFFQQRGDPVSAYTTAAIEQELVRRTDPAMFDSQVYQDNEVRRFEQLKAELAQQEDPSRGQR